MIYLYLKTMIGVSFYGNIQISKLHDGFKECDTIPLFSPPNEYTRIITAFCRHRLFPRTWRIDKP